MDCVYRADCHAVFYMQRTYATGKSGLREVVKSALERVTWQPTTKTETLSEFPGSVHPYSQQGLDENTLALRSSDGAWSRKHFDLQGRCLKDEVVLVMPPRGLPRAPGEYLDLRVHDAATGQFH